MLQLANWIMRGRFNALVAAAILGFIPLIAWTSVSVVALVALRRNAAEALWPLAGALVAASIQWNAGDVSQVGALLAAGIGAIVLANTRSLATSVLVTALVAALYLVVLVQWFPDRFDQLLAVFQLPPAELPQVIVASRVRSSMRSTSGRVRWRRRPRAAGFLGSGLRI